MFQSVASRLALIGCLLLNAQTFAQPDWLNEKRDHKLEPFTMDEKLRVCHATRTDTIDRHLDKILVKRVAGTPEILKVAQYIKRTLSNMGFETSFDRFSDNTPNGWKTFRNIIATFDAQAPRRLVLACHYDSKYFTSFEFLAATDSAVPCAMLLELAEYITPLMNSRKHNQIGLQLVFFDGEEAFKQWTATDSLYGSRHLAEKWYRQWYPTVERSRFQLNREIDRIDLFVLLDLLGAARPQIVNHANLRAEHFFSELPQIEADLRFLNCLRERPQIFYDRRSNGAVQDDHIPFIQRGVRALHLISTPFPRVWHNSLDTRAAVDMDTVFNLQAVVHVFVARYLGISP